MPEIRSKPLLILDLDETLIHATECALDAAPDFRVGPYFVYRRPHLTYFLESVSEAFDLAIWSSASGDYVELIVRQCFPQDITLSFQWANSRCTSRLDPEWQENYWVKDLSKVKRLGFDLSRVLMVDDTPKKLERNYGNAVYVQAFEGDKDDDELRRLAPYLISLAHLDDFRRIEKRGWRTKTQ